jgi:peptidylglycine monooxygenase
MVNCSVLRFKYISYFSEYFEVACEMAEDKVIYPFAFRTHTHKLGLVNSGYRVTTISMPDINNEEQIWSEIGRRSPQLPQMFYPVMEPVPIKYGDIIAARCTMKNPTEHNVYIGPTSNDEMCNFYFMYYVDGNQTLNDNLCVSRGPPNWYFEDFIVSNKKKIL